MILCSGCSKSGTHFLTSLMVAMGKEQLGGTLIKRPKSKLFSTSKRPLSDLLSQDNSHFMHGHVIYRAPLVKRLSEHRHLFILRHPRNIAISWMRHRIKQNPELEAGPVLLEQIIRGGMFGHEVPKFISLHLDWQHEPETLTVRFEDLAARDMAVLEKICAYVGEPTNPDLYDKAFGASSTFTGSFSTWSDNPIWTDAVEQAWQDTGGPRVEEAAGY
ncbi:sulfotransferase domain-containing protein [uncultured Sulfitobacter sp.]|uniref:sulfotransferase domain-containing protein n=1 Tax=uncultured Sulfitobacter sp. TaxID=191468 RepID=UPI00262BE351|nr:sulfotransferase domain-containing protein [uncultured Sulfitobacter sp.]